MDGRPGENAPRLFVELLGRFAVHVDDREVDSGSWPGRRAAELVQLLALSDGHRLARERVAEALWPHLEPGAAFANLRKAAHRARQALGFRDAVVLRGGVAMLDPDGGVDTDAARFVRAAEEALRRRDAEAALGAAELCRGALLPESLYEEWTREARGHVASLLAGVLRLAGRWERLIALDPLDESAYRALVRQALDRGNRPAALRWYDRLRSALAAELGVAPDPESEALYQECIAGLHPAEPDLVGRQVELAAAAGVLRAPGAVAAIAVRGAPGIGKSGLCRAVAERAAAEGWEVVAVSNRLAADAYGPLGAVIEELGRRDRARLAALPAATRSVLAALTPLAGPAPPLEGPLVAYRVLGALRRLLAAFAGPRGALLVVEDAHRADRASIEVLLELGGPGQGGALLVLSYRPELAGAALAAGVARLDREGRLAAIDLGPLEDEAAAALAAAAAPPGADPAAVARAAELGEGNPFFTRELARGIGAEGAVAIPSTIGDAILARFVELDPGSLKMLERLALAGDDLDTAEVLALTGLAEAEAFALLDAALGCGALVVAETRYRFRHTLLRQALAARLAPHQRVAVHRDAARRLAGAHGSPARIAEHWLAGGRPAEAIAWLLRAARRAASLGAFADALAHLDRLLEHDAENAEALTRRAEVLDALGDGRALQAYAVAAARAGEAAGDVRSRQALAQLKSGDPEGALATLENASPVTAAARISRALTISGAAAIGFGDSKAAAEVAAEARRLALESGDAGAMVEASWAQSLAAHAGGRLPAHLRAELAATRELPEVAIRVFDGHLCASERLLYGARPYADIIEFARSLAAEAERLGAGRGRAFAVTLGGEAELLSGQLDAAERDLAEGARLHQAIGAPAGQALALQRLGEVAIYRGRDAEATERLERALDAARESYLGHHLLDRIYGARIAAAGPERAPALIEEAERAIRGPLETCPACRITLAVPAAIAAARAGDLERARGYATTAEALAAVIARLPAWDAAVDEVRGHLALAGGDAGAARERFAAASAAYDRAGQPLDAERCRLASP